MYHKKSNVLPEGDGCADVSALKVLFRRMKRLSSSRLSQQPEKRAVKRMVSKTVAATRNIRLLTIFTAFRIPVLLVLIRIGPEGRHEKAPAGGVPPSDIYRPLDHDPKGRADHGILKVS
jgi:hypothetical protein